jgi:glycosyltransferase involved in cell wall biosynthesis
VTRIRIVDYVANPGGGLRFSIEMLRAITSLHPKVELELVGYGRGLSRYRSELARVGVKIPTRAILPRGYLANLTAIAARKARVVDSWPGSAGRMRWHYEVPRRVVEGCDLLWLPWAHRHRFAGDVGSNAFVSYFDTIIVKYGQMQPPNMQALVESEAETTRQLLASNARMVLSSKATVADLGELFGARPERFDVIPLASEKPAQAPAEARAVSPPAYLPQRYLFFPANTSPHKNHEMLFRALAEWKGRVPVVLSGGETNLAVPDRPGSRVEMLRAVAAGHGLKVGRNRDSDVIPLGYVEEKVYASVLDSAWALLMPTLDEGYGLPIHEAMVRGVPVLCSDIPVLREHVERVGASVIWFDPRDPRDLIRALEELERDYEAIRAKAIAQVPHISRRRWVDVARDYLKLFGVA